MSTKVPVPASISVKICRSLVVPVSVLIKWIITLPIMHDFCMYPLSLGPITIPRSGGKCMRWKAKKKLGLNRAFSCSILKSIIDGNNKRVGKVFLLMIDINEIAYFIDTMHLYTIRLTLMLADS